jgi:hypothetical protein
MKTIILFLSCFVFSFSAFAQQLSVDKNMSTLEKNENVIILEPIQAIPANAYKSEPDKKKIVILSDSDLSMKSIELKTIEAVPAASYKSNVKKIGNTEVNSIELSPVMAQPLNAPKMEVEE